jgi:hypothetical protein
MRFLSKLLPLEWLVPKKLDTLRKRYVGSGLYLWLGDEGDPLRLDRTAMRIFMALDGTKTVAALASELADELAESATSIQRETFHLMAEMTARGWAGWKVIKRKSLG